MKFYSILFIFILAVLTTSCNKRLADPHLHDPIYLSIREDIENLEITVKEKKARADLALLNAGEATPQTGEGSSLLSQHFNMKKELRSLDQKILYQKLQLRKREREAREMYDHAFQNGEKWPSPSVIERYELHKKLLEAAGKRYPAKNPE